MCAFSVVLITPAHSPEQPTVVYSLPLQGGCGGPASITGTTPRPSARSSTSQPPVALVAHNRPHSGRLASSAGPWHGAGCADGGLPSPRQASTAGAGAHRAPTSRR